MHTTSFITKTVHVHDASIKVGDQVVYEGEKDEPFAIFAKQAFKYLEVDYPKFYKMDALSKMAFLGAEYILQSEEKEGLALVLANRSGSLDTDVRHQQSIQDTANIFPSPATFVYTLSNICLGEISIRHQLQTENAFFVFEEYPADFMQKYADYLLVSAKAKRVLCGWVEYFQEKYRAVLYLVDQNGQKPHTTENINELFES